MDHQHHQSSAVTRDPVCGMTVDMGKTPHRTTHEGREIGFCSAGCKAKFEATPGAYLKATDPVCGMQVDRVTAKHMLKHEGVRYYFCCEGCQKSFEADPAKYLNAKPFVLPGAHGGSVAPSGQPAAGHLPRPAGEDHGGHHHGHHGHAHAPAGAKWTCPMHPEIVKDGPGDCPICGMALEPMVASLDDGPNPELVDFTRRLWVSAALSIPILILAMGGMVGIPVREWIGEEVSGWLELILATPVVLWAAWPFLRRFWNSLVNRSPNMWTLIGLGVGAAYLFSVVAVLFPQIFPMSMTHMGSKPPVYFEAAAVIVALVFVGQVLELRARDATGKAIRALLNLAPKTARRVWQGRDYEVPIEASNAAVIERFEADPSLEVLPVVQGSQPVGMINRHSMVDRFARPFRRELFGRKSCDLFMDHAPLVVDQHATIQELAMMLSLAPRHYLLDGFIVTGDGEYLGVGSSHDLMGMITEMQISAARYANPLTQLPGNVPINEHVDRLLAAGSPFVAVYVDIDNFKPFNDTYGYRRGDDVIQILARLLCEQVDERLDFVGHIGGDDFFVVFRSADWEMRCWETISRFAEAVANMLGIEERLSGGYMAENRRGELSFNPSPTLSLGAVRVGPGECESHREVAAAASGAKKQAKKRSRAGVGEPAGGSLFVERRRLGEGASQLLARPMIN